MRLVSVCVSFSVSQVTAFVLRLTEPQSVRWCPPQSEGCSPAGVCPLQSLLRRETWEQDKERKISRFPTSVLHSSLFLCSAASEENRLQPASLAGF